jgi:hypothetical protein
MGVSFLDALDTTSSSADQQSAMMLDRSIHKTERSPMRMAKDSIAVLTPTLIIKNKAKASRNRL